MSGSLFFNPEQAEEAVDTLTRNFFRTRDADDANQFMDSAEGYFRDKGMKDAAENLRRYRDGSGRTRVFSRAEIDQYPEFSRAEDANRSRFESATFTGRTRDRRVNQPLLDLQDGQTAQIADHWERGIGAPVEMANLLEGPEAAAMAIDPEDSAKSRARYFAFGRTTVRSQGRFNATRRGDDVEISGTVEHGLRETAGNPRGEEAFDFNDGQIGSPQARILEGAGQAKPFNMSYSKLQDVTARLRRNSDGSLVLRGIQWGPLQ